MEQNGSSSLAAWPQLLGHAETQFIKLSIPLERLPGTFRQALLRREESDKSITLGWPICTGVDRSAPKVWPVGLFSGQYERTDTELCIEFDLQNLFVNPLWARENHRNIGWNHKQLQDLFQIDQHCQFRLQTLLENCVKLLQVITAAILRPKSLRLVLTRPQKRFGTPSAFF